MVRLGKAGKMGRGVFATQFISAYSEIMRCHTLFLTKADLKKIEQTSISKHYFRSSDGNDHFALGLVTMLNHSKIPNVEIYIKKTPQGYIAICQSITDIKIRNQLFMDYGEIDF